MFFKKKSLSKRTIAELDWGDGSYMNDRNTIIDASADRYEGETLYEELRKLKYKMNFSKGEAFVEVLDPQTVFPIEMINEIMREYGHNGIAGSLKLSTRSITFEGLSYFQRTIESRCAIPDIADEFLQRWGGTDMISVMWIENTFEKPTYQKETDRYADQVLQKINELETIHRQLIDIIGSTAPDQYTEMITTSFTNMQVSSKDHYQLLKDLANHK